MEEQKKTNAEANAIVDELLEQYSKTGKMGSAIHVIPEVVFSTEEDINPTEVKNDIHQLYPDVNLSDEVVANVINQLLEVKAYLKARHGDNCKFLTEHAYEVTNEADGFKYRGIIDLIVVDENGVPHIYDFKTSSKNIAEYNKSKVSAYSAQLGLYRHILGKKGFNINQIQLGIIPIVLDDIEWDTMTPSKVTVDVNEIQSLENSEQLNTSSGYLTKALNSFLPLEVVQFRVGSEYTDDTSNLLVDALNYQPKLVSKPKDVAYFIKKNKEKGYFYNILTGKKVTFVEGQEWDQVTEYLNSVNESDMNAASSLGDNLSLYINGSREVLYGSSDKSKLKFDEAHFLEYKKTGWNMNRDFEHLGIIVLYHPQRKVLDVLNITANDLGMPVKLHYGDTILGNFLTNAKVGDSRIISSNVANIELLRSLIIMNNLINNGLFNGYKFG